MNLERAHFMTNDRLRPVRLWLYCLALMILIMVTVGGLTRLTGSGLSITSWKPIAGIIPPLSASDWQIEFEAYQRIPEFQIENRWMEIADFKSIFWWEWGHRFLGRMIGFAFLGPFLVFLAQKRLSWRLAPGLGLLFVLGGFQGFLGWWCSPGGSVWPQYCRSLPSSRERLLSSASLTFKVLH